MTISVGIFVFLIASATNFVRPKSQMIEPIGHSPAAADSNLVFRIRYGQHNNIIALITDRAAVLAVPHNSLSKLVYFFPLSKTIMIYYQIFVQANYGLVFRKCTLRVMLSLSATFRKIASDKDKAIPMVFP